MIQDKRDTQPQGPSIGGESGTLEIVGFGNFWCDLGIFYEESRGLVFVYFVLSRILILLKGI